MPQAVAFAKTGEVKSAIPDQLRPEQGRVLSIYGDAGWGRLVAQSKYETGHFSDELVHASVTLMRDHWKPDPAPEGIACVPSKRNPLLVADFARRLALQLGIPFLPIIEKTRETKPQKRMENSTQQVRNLLEAFSVSHDILAAPVFLVDDDASVRDALGLKEGDRVLFRVLEGRAVLAKVQDFLDLAGSVNVSPGNRNAAWREIKASTWRRRAMTRK